MYFITYVDRVNIGTAASEIQKELGFRTRSLGFVFSAFAYPYLLFQIIGGWVGDNSAPRKTLFWCGLIWAAATILTGFASGLASLFVARVAARLRRGRDLPDRNARDAELDAGRQAAASRKVSPTPSRGWAMPSRRRWSPSDRRLDLARLVRRARAASAWSGSSSGSLFPQRAQGPSGHHRGRAATLPPRPTGERGRRCRGGR